MKLALLQALLVCACEGTAGRVLGRPISRFSPGVSWQMQLTTPVDTSVDAQVYEIDAFDNDRAVVEQLHAQGRLVIAYVNAGRVEEFRPDAAAVPPAIVGEAATSQERWLDIRRLDLLGPWIGARLDMIAAKGFDAVDADSVDGFQTTTGFDITADDALSYERWLAEEAHRRGLAIALKNDPLHAAELAHTMDLAVSEECLTYGWCAELEPFVRAGRAVLMCEHTEAGITVEQMCAAARALGFSAILKNIALDSWRSDCAAF